MCKIQLRKAKTRRRQRKLRLLSLVIVLLALIVLTSCQTTAKTDKAALQILISQIPDVPEVPSWPSVTWGFEDGKYYLTEPDVDKVLYYLENDLPRQEFEVKQYKEQLKMVIDGILSI